MLHDFKDCISSSNFFSSFVNSPLLMLSISYLTIISPISISSSLTIFTDIIAVGSLFAVMSIYIRVICSIGVPFVSHTLVIPSFDVTFIFSFSNILSSHLRFLNTQIFQLLLFLSSSFSLIFLYSLYCFSNSVSLLNNDIDIIEFVLLNPALFIRL